MLQVCLGAIKNTASFMKPKFSNILTFAQIGRDRWPQKRASGERWGYIGAHSGRNLGDDAMFDALKDAWKTMWPDRQLVSVELPWHERRLGRVGLSGPPFFSGGILGGGTLIGPFWESQVRTMLRQGVPMWSLGTGAGSCGFIQPYQLDLATWTPLLKDFVRIGVRGPLSVDKLRAIGIDNAEVIGDLALILTRETLQTPSQTPQVAFNLSLPRSHEENYDEKDKLREVETVLREIVKRGWKIAPFAMNAVDLEPTRAALAGAGIENLEIPLLTSVDEFWRIVGPSTFVVAVRLHAAILAACAGVPTLMLGYRDKCMDFMASMDLQEWHVDLESDPTGVMIEKARALCDAAPGLRAPVLSRAQHWQETLRAYNRDIANHARAQTAAAV